MQTGRAGAPTHREPRVGTATQDPAGTRNQELDPEERRVAAHCRTSQLLRLAAEGRASK